MSEKLEFKLIVTDSGKEVLNKLLSFEEVQSIVYAAYDSKDNEAFFTVAARHSASSVRESVAEKDSLSDSTVKTLFTDKSINVLRNLIRCRQFKERATLEQLEALITLDKDIAESIASDIESYTKAGPGKLAALLAGHSDPSVARSLAGGYKTPKKILKTLLKHNDSRVASEAKDTLKYSVR
jgi:hypothetical protein